MALGKRKQKQTFLWEEISQLQTPGRHPFYSRLNEALDPAKFDNYAERICRKYYTPTRIEFASHAAPHPQLPKPG